MRIESKTTYERLFMVRIVFMGTPDFAVPSLEGLIREHEVIGVVTQPDRPAGRKGKLKAPPIKDVALTHNIPVMQPLKIRKKAAVEELMQWEADLYIVAAFGQILPQKVLDIPQYRCLNVHGSLLPRWRGAAPIHASIRAGDAETGVTIMKMDAGLDTGDMLTKAVIPIDAQETGQSLHDKMAIVGADLLIQTLPDYLAGKITPEVQNEDLVTYAPQMKKEDGLIDWSDSAQAIDRHVRAYTPWPGTFTHWNGNTIKVHKGKAIDGKADVGKVIENNGSIAVGTGNGLYQLESVQISGKKRMAIADFMNGYGDFIESTLGTQDNDE